jgi:hypothetical protein
MQGFWTVNFSHPNSGTAGGGVIAIQNQRILGGDSSYMYQGTLQVNGNVVTGNIEVTRHSSFMSPSIFGGTENFHLNLSGTMGDEKLDPSQRLDLEGYMVENPSLKIRVNGVRRADLN